MKGRNLFVGRMGGLDGTAVCINFLLAIAKRATIFLLRKALHRNSMLSSISLEDYTWL